MKNIPKKVRDDSFWKDVYALAIRFYAIGDEVIKIAPSEEWRTVSKLRNAASDSLFYASQAVGNSAPEAASYDLNFTRKNLFALQSMYTFATKQAYIELDPELVVKIDKIISEIDTRITLSKEEAKKKNDEELQPWLEKYRLWQKMQD